MTCRLRPSRPWPLRSRRRRRLLYLARRHTTVPFAARLRRARPLEALALCHERGPPPLYAASRPPRQRPGQHQARPLCALCRHPPPEQLVLARRPPRPPHARGTTPLTNRRRPSLRSSSAHHRRFPPAQTGHHAQPRSSCCANAKFARVPGVITSGSPREHPPPPRPPPAAPTTCRANPPPHPPAPQMTRPPGYYFSPLTGYRGWRRPPAPPRTHTPKGPATPAGQPCQGRQP